MLSPYDATFAVSFTNFTPASTAAVPTAAKPATPTFATVPAAFFAVSRDFVYPDVSRLIFAINSNTFTLAHLPQSTKVLNFFATSSATCSPVLVSTFTGFKSSMYDFSIYLCCGNILSNKKAVCFFTALFTCPCVNIPHKRF